jgi:hypothetical protein
MLPQNENEEREEEIEAKRAQRRVTDMLPSYFLSGWVSEKFCPKIFPRHTSFLKRC